MLALSEGEVDSSSIVLRLLSFIHWSDLSLWMAMPYNPSFSVASALQVVYESSPYESQQACRRHYYFIVFRRRLHPIIG